MMRHRWSRVIISLLITAAVYQLYAVFAVRLIEPQPDLENSSHGNLALPADAPLQQRLETLSAFFPGRTQLIRNAKMLEIDQATLLFQDYWNLGEGRVLVRPCLLVFDSRTTVKKSWPSGFPEVFILEALDGAIFQFDRPLDLRTARIGRFIAGQILGNITLRGEGDGPNRQDFRLTTRDITITEHRLWTNHPLELSWGRHRARGAGLEIVFFGRSPLSRTGSRDEPLMVDRFLLRHVDRLHLDLAALQSGKDSPRRASPTESQPVPSEDDVLDVTCQGPLLFVPGQKTATLEERVELLRTQNGTPILKLQCHQLVVTFTEARPGNVGKEGNFTPDTAAGSSNSAPVSDNNLSSWTIHLVRAVGEPVRILFPAWRAELEGTDLRYDVVTGVMSLDGPQGVHGKREKDRFTAQSIQCQISRRGEVQALAAVGPGMASVTPPGVSAGWTLKWGKILSVTSGQGERILSLQGGAEISVDPVGSLKADQVWCWAQAPGLRPADFTSIRIRRFLAESRVEAISSQFVARTDRLEAWINFEELPAPPNASTSPEKPPGQDSTEASQNRLLGDGGQILLQARLLRMEVTARNGQAPEIMAISADGNVLADEQVHQPDCAPFQMRGEHLEITQPARPTTIFSLTGNPAYLAGRGLALTGDQIFLDRGRNLLSVAGAGRLHLNKSARGLVPLAVKDSVAVQWNQGMDFAGRTLSFQGAVQLTSGSRQLRAESLSIDLVQPVQFSDLSTFDAYQARLARAVGNVYIENVEIDAAGNLAGRDILCVSEISIDFGTGQIFAPGPGRLSIIRSGVSATDLFQRPSATPPAVSETSVVQDTDPTAQSGLQSEPVADTPSSSGGSPEPRLLMLDVSFQQYLQGNIHERRAGCYGRVKARYGEITTWTADALPDDPRLLGANGMLLNCHELIAYQIVSPGREKPHFELMAQGNVTLEAQLHTARARRISVDESKTLIVLEGDGDVPAELYRQEFRGGPVQKTTARRIYFWYTTKTVKVDDAKSLEITRSPGLPLGQ